MTHLHNLIYHWILATAVLLLFSVQNSLSEEPTCTKIRKMIKDVIRDSDEYCEAEFKVAICSGVSYSSNYFTSRTPPKEVYSTCCSGVEYRVKPRKVNYRCESGRIVTKRVFIPNPTKCGRINGYDIKDFS